MIELSGDVLALELFCLYGKYGMEKFGPYVGRGFVRQMEAAFAGRGAARRTSAAGW